MVTYFEASVPSVGGYGVSLSTLDCKVRKRWPFYACSPPRCSSTLKVTINEERWTVPQFYSELFNYCFPVDYRMQLRKTLALCHQNDKSVTEYTHELQDLFNMIGDISPQDQVIKFWNGAKPAIQKELWRNKLNPELSSWRKVVSQAEIIEIAENVAERQDKRSGPTLNPLSSTSGPSGNSNRSKQTTIDGAVRAVTFGSPKHSNGRSRGGNHSHKRHGGHERSQHMHSSRGSTTAGKVKSVSVPLSSTF